MDYQRRNSAAEHQRRNDDWDRMNNDWLAVQAKQKEKKQAGIVPQNDTSEKEADTVAEKVVSGETVDLSGMSGAGTVQRKGETDVPEPPNGFINNMAGHKGGGTALAPETQSALEANMGSDFSGVKIHTGSAAAGMAGDINAKAFTHGQDIFFGEGQFNPQSKEGKELLAHELVHTHQNSHQPASGLVQAKLMPEGKKQSGPGDGSTNYRFDTYQITGEDLSDPDITGRIHELGEYGLIQYIGKTKDPDVMNYIMEVLNETYPDLPTIADIVYIELSAKDADRHIPVIFSSLQKLLKAQDRIDLFKTLYQKREMSGLEGHLRQKLAGTDLELALDLINIKDDAAKEGMVNTALPVSADDYKTLALKINAALTAVPPRKQEVFAALIPFNHNTAQLSTLAASYGSNVAGHKLNDDIATQLSGEDVNYGLYLMNGMAPKVTHQNEATMTSTGTENTEQITGGRINVNAGADYKKSDGTVRPAGFVIGYQGGLIPDSHWLQFIWREIISTKTVDKKEEDVRQDDMIKMTGGEYQLTKDPEAPNYNTDTAVPGNPFYEVGFVDNRTSEATTIFDWPGYVTNIVNREFDAGATRVISRAHFNTFLIRDYYPVCQVITTVEWDFSSKDTGPKVTSSKINQTISSLPKAMKDRLTAQFPNFNYIR